MVANLKPLGQFADGDEIPAGEPLDRQQGLVLLRRQARGARGLPAKTLKAPKRVAQLGQEAVVGLCDTRGRHGFVVGVLREAKGAAGVATIPLPFIS